MAGRMKRILQIDYASKQDEKRIHHYLERYAKYKRLGLFGFALPVAVFSALEEKAGEENCTSSEMLQDILEECLKDRLVVKLETADAVAGETNLITTKVYGKQNGKSPEQIKQYLHQKNRLPGAVKVGRDWVIPRDTRFPEDLRGNVKE